jgi:hypothetical protein
MNNAGKSALMRFLVEFRPFFNRVANAGQLWAVLNDNLSQVAPDRVTDGREVFSNLNDHGIEFWFDFSYPEPRTAIGLVKAHFFVDMDFRWRATVHTNAPVKMGPDVGIQDGVIVEGGVPKCDLSELLNLGQILAETLYIGPFRNAINVGSNDSYLDIQVGQAFIRQFRHLKTGPERRLNREILALQNEIKKIFEFNDLTIDATPDDTSLHLTVNGKPYKQHELGSGLVQFVLVLANASLRRPKLILIDEPELNLHPRLQLDFLTTLATYATEGVWFSTHSIGLARASASRIYSVRRHADGDSRVRDLEATLRLSEFLGEMSFSAHQELGFRRLLLVEGPTDVTAFQQILRAMGKDHEVVLLPLGGRMPKAPDLDEILRITTAVSVVIDSEREQAGAPLAKDRQEFVQLCQTRSIACKVLDYRAIENYFPDDVIKQTFGGAFRALGPFEKFNNLNPHWSKDDNWRLARAWPLEGVKRTDLGLFLDAL